MITALLSACNGGGSSKAEDQKISVNVAALKGPTGIGMVNLIQQAKDNKAPDHYNFTISGAPDEVSAKLISGELDIAAIPTNLAATLYQKTKGAVQVAAVNTLGVIYVVENGSTVNSVADLKGKELYATGQASTPEYTLDYILEKNGLTAGTDVKETWLTEHTELAAKMIAGDVKLGVLPEPFVTQALAKNKNLRVALDLTAEWNKAAGNNSKVTTGCLVVRKDFADKHPNEFKAFLDAYKKSANTAVSDIDTTAQLSEKYDIMTAAIAKSAIPKCNIVYIDGSEMKTVVSGFLQVLFDANPKSVGGSMPDNNFYYKK
jgi:NitT/TauT family transport system substrate-binding protein